MTLCRLCGKNIQNSIQLVLDDSIKAKLSETFKFKLHDDENFSKVICSKCNDKLSESHHFCMTIRKVQNSLYDEHEYEDGMEFMEVKKEPKEETAQDLTEVFIKTEAFENFSQFRSSRKRKKPEEESPTKTKKKGRKTSKSSSSSKSKKSHLKPPIENPLDLIYKSELEGTYTDSFLTLSLPQTSLLDDGRLSPSTQLQFSNFKWSNYDWKCSTCSTSFSNILDLDSHLKSSHKSKFTQNCDECGIICNSFASFTTHIIKYHNTNARFSCIGCSEIFWNLKDLHVHQKEVHRENCPKVCIYCGFYFLECKTLEFHLISTHNRVDRNPKMFCDFCEFETTNKSKVWAHMKIHRKYSQDMCELCGATFKRLGDVVTHRKYVHGSQSSVACDQCPKTFKTMLSLRRHKKVVHQKRDSDFKFSCECGKKFRSQYKLKDHQISHDPNGKRYQCQHCDKSFKYSSGFLYHVRSVHTNEKPYACPCCESKFFDYPNASKHIRGSHGSDLKPVYLNKV